MKSILIVVVLTHFSKSMVMAQDLEQHVWKDRILILFQTNEDDNSNEIQLKELNVHSSGMEERRIVVYQVRPDRWKNGLEDERMWNALSNNPFERYRLKSGQNEIVLIGLDGGVKLRKNEFIGCDELFALIDGMPMRRRELRSNQKN